MIGYDDSGGFAIISTEEQLQDKQVFNRSEHQLHPLSIQEQSG